MQRVNDVGGQPAGPIDRTDHELADWEVLADALSQAMGARGLRRTDESRRAMEDLPPDQYRTLSYYERWAAGAETLLVEKGVLTREEIDCKMAEIEASWGEP